MASIEQRGRSTRVITYVDNEKLTFPLGRVPKKTADRFANNIEALLHEKRCGIPPSREVGNWLAGLDDTLYGLLEQRELVEPRLKAQSLSEFCDAYISGRNDVTERRLVKLRGAAKRMTAFFGDVKLNAITPGDADEYAKSLLASLAPATAQKECQIANQFFRHASRKKLIDSNPFDGVTVGKATNDERRVFVERATIERVIDACPNWQWRLVVALARYGGLRCPSEIAPLQWADIHWDENRFTVTSPKTQRYGKGSRVVPIFPELRPFLDEAFSMAAEGEQFVVPMLQGDGSKNLGTTLKKIIRRAGIEPWPKTFQNLRSSRQTELEQQHPTYVVCSWMGNTPKVAHNHYLTVTEENFAAAIKNGDASGMQTLARSCKDPHSRDGQVQKVPENARFSEIVAIYEKRGLAVEGLEPTTLGL